MKIAVIVGSFPSLSETFILNQITGMIDAGYAVEIFPQAGDPGQPAHPEVKAYALQERTFYPPLVPKNRMLRNLKAVWLLFRAAVLDPRVFWKILSGPGRREIFKLTPFIGKRFAVVHAHFGGYASGALILKDLGICRKLLTSFHGYDVNSYPGQNGKNVYAALIAKGDYYTANTGFTRDRAVELGFSAEKIDILPESLDLEKFSFQERSADPSQEIKILTIARLVEKKGHVYALRAIKKLSVKYRISYVIAGDGPLEAEIRRQSESLGLRDIVCFRGPVEETQALALYRAAQIFLLPSITAADNDREGQALVLQEAQACGLPVVSTLHNGIPEGVRDGISAFLVPEKDVEALAEKLEYLILNPQLWAQMGKAGEEFVREKFDRVKINARLAAIYKKMGEREQIG